MQQYRTLIEMGAGRPGSLADRQLTQLVGQMQTARAALPCSQPQGDIMPGLHHGH